MLDIILHNFYQKNINNFYLYSLQFIQNYLSIYYLFSKSKLFKLEYMKLNKLNLKKMKMRI